MPMRNSRGRSRASLAAQHQQMLQMQQAAQFSNSYLSNSPSNQNLQQPSRKLPFPASEFFHPHTPLYPAAYQQAAQGRPGVGGAHASLAPSASAGAFMAPAGGSAGQPAVPRPGSSASTHSAHSQQSATLQQQYPTAADLLAGQQAHQQHYQQHPLVPTASAPPASQVRAVCVLCSSASFACSFTLT